MTHTDHSHAPDDPLHNEGVDHEHSDVNIRAILMFAAGLAAVGIVVHVAMWLLFGFFERQAAANDPPIPPLAAPAVQMPRTTTGAPNFSSTPGPQLLTNEYMALEKQRAMEAERLHGYGWVDQKNNVAFMPIEEAKSLLLKRGVPARGGPPVSPTLGTRLPAYGESSGGRMITPPTGALMGAAREGKR
jgi:hypothetical protein